ncbi:M23 family metallopeptidase [Candidatus Woesearchaeota archaeon]|jgi:murein DD-endopeptidase MepM/ murein hydrolase activator NlpD|nr:M23 family metallopeptidase [Candidatus Woesearchaeota archaeon]MBT3304747.1 M23 family metallopeptidase [Candidatus Woesearchaeota archaeon]MBT4367917.1 M23 family metallopeptidase [Candidatus Woesearchaeota archaeon]MBT4712405.1 M23 family metallopeptidase [Candidatus Woesearchaeota archaeon]MBT6639317.1 M23 family metallopeptidase [Candidatus Woesearchaeota archaeon]
MIRRVTLDRKPELQRGYRLPFEGDVQISQGNNGPWSHFSFQNNGRRTPTTYDFRFSVDFKVPPGTQVIAAKDGIQCGFYNAPEECYEGEDIEGGWGVKTNFVFLRHENNMMTCYSHLSREGFRFRDGEFVKQGEVIAETGMSGWIGPTPHLHFGVFSLLVDSVYMATFPVSFDNYHGTLDHAEVFSAASN